MSTKGYVCDRYVKWDIKRDTQANAFHTFFKVYRDGEYVGRVLAGHNPTVRECVDILIGGRCTEGKRHGF